MRLVIVPDVENMFDVVAFTPVKFCRVVEEVTKRLLVVALPPSRFLATKADGTDPIIFLGDISPSHVGVTLSVPPISTPKYSVWLKSIALISVVEPTITENNPLTTGCLLLPVSVSVNIGDPPVALV